METKTQVKHVVGCNSNLYEALHRIGWLPRNCTRFVITSEVGKPIRIEADYFPEEIKNDGTGDYLASKLSDGEIS
jgi:hypothetical protein